MKIYTKQGDKGQTSLVDGSPIKKSDIRLKTYGTVDELNSHLGLLISFLQELPDFSSDCTQLAEVQAWLFQLGSQLANTNPDMAQKLPTISEAEVSNLEQQMDQWDKELPPLKNFILPGGHQASAQAHICRTVSRRAERNCVELDEQDSLGIPAVQFLNRLSDYFYVFARVINQRQSIDCPEWKA